MTRFLLLAGCAVTLATGCTLILDTSEIIAPCAAEDDCDKGFSCVDNACLPDDDEDPSES